MKAVLDREAGQAQKELGLFAAYLNNTDFIAKARAVAKLICAVSGSVTMDDIRTHPSMQGLQPSSSHTWGAILHGPDWKFIGYEKSALKSNRARRICRMRYQP